MVYVIDLVSSSSPSVPKLPPPSSSPKFVESHEKSFDYFNPKLSSSPCSVKSSRNRTARRGNILKSSLSQSFDNEAYEKFKRKWRKDRVVEIESESAESEMVDTETIESPVNSRLMNFLKSPVGLRRRASETFQITPTKTHDTTNLFTSANITFKNKAEAVNSVRIYMSNSMAEAYEQELRRRFSERQMSNTVAFDISSVLIPGEMASFRWKFVTGTEFLEPRLFVLDSETLWNDFIATKRFNDLLQAYNEPNVFLYFINWKRAMQRHTIALNRQFKQALNTSSERISLTPANELENEFFLTAARLRLQVNFSGATNAPQSLVDLMDFVVEMTRVVALKGYLSDSQTPQDEELNLTVARDVKVKSGKDARDCWVKVLCQIPRVTPHLADVIVERYPSFASLMNAYDLCRTRREGEELLAELRLDDRRLGPIISARIYNHFQ